MINVHGSLLEDSDYFQVKRVLPDWLANPSVISADLTKDKLPVTEMNGLAKDLVQLLEENSITHFFPGSSYKKFFFQCFFLSDFWNTRSIVSKILLRLVKDFHNPEEALNKIKFETLPKHKNIY